MVDAGIEPDLIHGAFEIPTLVLSHTPEAAPVIRNCSATVRDHPAEARKVLHET